MHKSLQNALWIFCKVHHLDMKRMFGHNVAVQENKIYSFCTHKKTPKCVIEFVGSLKYRLLMTNLIISRIFNGLKMLQVFFPALLLCYWSDTFNPNLATLQPSLSQPYKCDTWGRGVDSSNQWIWRRGSVEQGVLVCGRWSFGGFLTSSQQYSIWVCVAAIIYYHFYMEVGNA